MSLQIPALFESSIMHSSNPFIIKAESIGSIALETLSKDQDAHVFGKTSQGVFINTSGKRLIFLSFERFRGPLIITFDSLDPVLQQVSNGGSVWIASKSMFLPDLDARITTGGSQVWQPPPPSAPLLTSPDRYEKLVGFAKEILSEGKAAGLASLIPYILGFPDAEHQLQGGNGIHWANIEQLNHFIRTEDVSSLAGLLSNFLGSGPGLTPSADDFIIGLLLTMNRWGIPPWSKNSLRELNLRVVKAAYGKTTMLSANLIECAVQGLANERLINVLDWILTGEGNGPKIAADLLGWGHSSGIDTFVGMAVALYAD